MFAVNLNLVGRRCILVGAGSIALRKAQSLIEEGADLTVVSPTCVAGFEPLIAARRLAFEPRPYRPGEARDGYALAFAATNDRAVNRQVFEDANAAGIFVNVADDPELCTFHLAGRVRRAPLELTLSSDGRAPFLVRRLRDRLDAMLGPEWNAWAEAAADLRLAVRSSGLPAPDQEACFDRFVQETLDPGALRVRVPSVDERSSWIAAAQAKAATAAVATVDAVALPATGFVSLVGAGPGAPGLLTVRGLQRLQQADVVVYDHLAEGTLPTTLSATVDLHNVGKQAGHHPVPQEEINALLVELGQSGRRVVRLKGGDPYVFGRGSEEAEALAAAGIPFEVVPGVTAAVGAMAYAGIPATHRGEAVQVTLLTAHESKKGGGAQVQWEALARQEHATLVGYMGVTRLRQTVSRLLEAGIAPETQAAMIEHGSTSMQRTVAACVAELPAAAEAAAVGAPALFVIGPTVHRAATLAWATDLSLWGERLAVAVGMVGLGDALEDAGAEIVRIVGRASPAARVVLAARPLTGCVIDDVSVEHLGGAVSCEPGGGLTAWCLSDVAAHWAVARGWSRVERVDSGSVAQVVAHIARRRVSRRA
jgi:uroporphyrin-III C-methyltransferase/precorrin-2 dehydrogenase/sirohydrochlorin ferrochelatase